MKTMSSERWSVYTLKLYMSVKVANNFLKAVTLDVHIRSCIDAKLTTTFRAIPNARNPIPNNPELLFLLL